MQFADRKTAEIVEEQMASRNRRAIEVIRGADYACDKPTTSLYLHPRNSQRGQLTLAHSLYLILHGDAAVWGGVRPERLLLLAGGYELYLHGVVGTGKLMGAREDAGSAVQIVVCPGEAHVQMGKGYMMEITDGYMLTAALSWFRSLGSQ